MLVINVRGYNEEGSSRSARSFSEALSGNDYKRLPTRRSENDGRHERIRFYVSSHTLQSSSVVGTDTYKTQQRMLGFIGLREPSHMILIAAINKINHFLFGVIFLRCHDIVKISYTGDRHDI